MSINAGAAQATPPALSLVPGLYLFPIEHQSFALVTSPIERLDHAGPSPPGFREATTLLALACSSNT